MYQCNDDSQRFPSRLPLENSQDIPQKGSIRYSSLVQEPSQFCWVTKLLILQKDVFHYLPQSTFTGPIQVGLRSLRMGGWLIPSHWSSSELWHVKYFTRSKSFQPNLKSGWIATNLALNGEFSTLLWTHWREERFGLKMWLFICCPNLPPNFFILQNCLFSHILYPNLPFLFYGYMLRCHGI